MGVDFTQQELDELFAETNEGQQSPAANEDGSTSSQQDNIENTKAFAKRLKERTDKAIADERENIAASLGYKSYSDMMKAKENKLLEDKGLDPEQVSPIVDELVQKRISEDPRFKELESYREKQVQEFAKKELDELSKLTGVQYTSLEQLPQDVVEDWKTSGSLKKSYMSLHGEELITKVRAASNRGTTGHMTPIQEGPTVTPNTGKRHLTDEEKKVWRVFNPGITQEELDKKMIDK